MVREESRWRGWSEDVRSLAFTLVRIAHEQDSLKDGFTRAFFEKWARKLGPVFDVAPALQAQWAADVAHFEALDQVHDRRVFGSCEDLVSACLPRVEHTHGLPGLLPIRRTASAAGGVVVGSRPGQETTPEAA